MLYVVEVLWLSTILMYYLDIRIVYKIYKFFMILWVYANINAYSCIMVRYFSEGFWDIFICTREGGGANYLHTL